MKRKEVGQIKMENARIIFRNFSGKADKYNPKGGARKFSVVIEDPEMAEELKKDGWNVKQLKPRSEDEEPNYHLSVKVNYDNRPPKIYLITKHHKTLLNEETVDSLDYADISKVDLVISPYPYNVNGSEGIAAYLKAMYVNVIEDDFADKYNFDEDDEEDELPFD